MLTFTFQCTNDIGCTITLKNQYYDCTDIRLCRNLFPTRKRWCGINSVDIGRRLHISPYDYRHYTTRYFIKGAFSYVCYSLYSYPRLGYGNSTQMDDRIDGLELPSWTRSRYCELKLWVSSNCLDGAGHFLNWKDSKKWSRLACWALRNLGSDILMSPNILEMSIRPCKKDLGILCDSIVVHFEPKYNLYSSSYRNCMFWNISS